MNIFHPAKEPDQVGLRAVINPAREPEQGRHEPVRESQRLASVTRAQASAVRPVATPQPKPVVAAPSVRLPATAGSVSSVALVQPPVATPAVAASVGDAQASAAAPVRMPSSAPVRKQPSPNNGQANGALLAVGVGVTLKGNMQCDLLRIEGNIEGDVKARKLVIVSGGTLVGTAEIDDAEIEGHFEGTLAVSGLLVVRSTGRLTGKFQYGEIEIERGGAVSGEVLLNTNGSVSTAPRAPTEGIRPVSSTMR